MNVNWLADWWNEAAYMAFREPVVVNVSYFYVHVPDADAGTDEAVCDARMLAPKRAARLLKAMLPFRTLVETCVMTSLLRGNYSCADDAVSVLNWNPRRSAVRRFAWIRTSGCKYTFIRTFEKKAR